MLCRDIVESRLVVNVFRELRRKQLKLEKGKGSGIASVSLAQLKRSFPTLSTYDITSRLRDRCECQPLPVSRFLHGVSHLFAMCGASQYYPDSFRKRIAPAVLQSHGALHKVNATTMRRCNCYFCRMIPLETCICSSLAVTSLLRGT